MANITTIGLDLAKHVFQVHGMDHEGGAVLRWQRGAPKKPSPWIGELLARRPTNIVLVAMANKTARTVWL